MHSCAPLVISEGVIISLDNLNQILEIDPEERWARVQPGVCVHELCNATKQYGLAVGTLGTIDWQTIVGAVMTGTHGGSLTTPSMHTFMDSYTLVKANCESMKVNRDSDPKLFSAMAPCMGVLGVVVEAKVRLVELEYLEAQMEALSFSEVIPKFQNHERQQVYSHCGLSWYRHGHRLESQSD
jgi:FAD/FMN-containing dehydrogenase